MRKYCLSFIFLILLCSGAVAQRTAYSLRTQGDSLIFFWGGKLLLSPQGFPQQITTSFTADGKDTTGPPTNMLAENIHFHIVNAADGKDIRLKSKPIEFRMRSSTGMVWLVYSESEIVDMSVLAVMRPDGQVIYTVGIKALQDVDLKDIVMHIPFEKGVAKYAVGIGLNGDYHPDSLYHWKWDANNEKEEAVWIGSANAGLKYALWKPFSWSNDGKGGIDIGIKGRSMLASNYSGAWHIKKGKSVGYNFVLSMNPSNTPIKIKR